MLVLPWKPFTGSHASFLLGRYLWWRFFHSDNDDDPEELLGVMPSFDDTPTADTSKIMRKFIVNFFLWEVSIIFDHIPDSNSLMVYIYIL